MPQELEFLAETHVISSAQLAQILTLLPGSAPTAVAALRAQTPALQAPAQSATPAVQHLGFTPPMSPPAATKTPAHEKAMLPSAGPPPPSYSPGPLVLSTAEAQWAFKGSEPGDLSFAAGDVVEVVEKVKDDWWRGRVAGQAGDVGLFPSSYVKERAVLAVGAKVPGLPDRGAGYSYGPGGNMMTDTAHAGPSGGYEQQQQQDEKKSALGKNGEKFGKKLGNGASPPWPRRGVD